MFIRIQCNAFPRNFPFVYKHKICTYVDKAYIESVYCCLHHQNSLFWKIIYTNDEASLAFFSSVFIFKERCLYSLLMFYGLHDELLWNLISLLTYSQNISKMKIKFPWNCSDYGRCSMFVGADMTVALSSLISRKGNPFDYLHFNLLLNRNIFVLFRPFLYSNQSIEVLNFIGLNCHFKYWLCWIRPNDGWMALFHQRNRKKCEQKWIYLFCQRDRISISNPFVRILAVCVCVARDDRISSEDNKSN